MTTITIEKNIKLQKTNFLTVDDLLDYLLSLDNSKIEFEDFNNEEIKAIDNLKSMKEFKNIVSNLKI